MEIVLIYFAGVVIAAGIGGLIVKLDYLNNFEYSDAGVFALMWPLALILVGPVLLFALLAGGVGAILKKLFERD